MTEDPITAAYETIHHYTTEVGLRGILESKSLWATDYRFLNDSSELSVFASALKKYARDISAEQAEEKERWLDLIEENALYWLKHYTKYMRAYLICFCPGIRIKNRNQEVYVDTFEQLHGRLSQWRGYARDGGYAIEFDTVLLEKLRAKEEAATKNGDVSGYAALSISTVCYFSDIASQLTLYRADDRKGTKEKLTQSYKELLDQFIKDSLADEISPNEAIKFEKNLFTCAARTKHFGFHEENEIRLIAWAETDAYKKHLESLGRPKNSMPAFKAMQLRPNNVPYIVLFAEEDFNELFTQAIKRIIVGPGSHQELRKIKVEMMLQKFGYSSVEVLCSDIPCVS